MPGDMQNPSRCSWVKKVGNMVIVSQGLEGNELIVSEGVDKSEKKILFVQ